MAYIAEQFNSWYTTQDRLRSLLGISNSKIQCLPFNGSGHALVDLIYGLRELWPTRRTITMMDWGTPHLRGALKGHIVSGGVVETLKAEFLAQDKSWLESPTKDQLVTILVRDHCFTGQILTDDETLIQLNKKRIPHIEIQHSWGWSRASLPLPFGIQIRILDANKAIVLFGERIRFQGHSAHLQDWTELNWEPALQKARHYAFERSQELAHFEAALIDLQKEYDFQMQLFRTRDSSFLENSSLWLVRGVNGDFFLNSLLAVAKVPNLALPGYENRCETTNLSRWMGLHPWDWWGGEGLAESDQRSLIVLSAAFICETLTPELVHKVYRDCVTQCRVASVQA